MCKCVTFPTSAGFRYCLFPNMLQTQRIADQEVARFRVNETGNLRCLLDTGFDVWGRSLIKAHGAYLAGQSRAVVQGCQTRNSKAAVQNSAAVDDSASSRRLIG